MNQSLSLGVWSIVATLEQSDGGVRLAIFTAVALVSLVLAVRGSNYLFEWFVFVSCFNRFVRRLLDWADGQYDPLPILSLLPQLVGGLAFLVVLSRYSVMSRASQRALQLLLAAIVIGLALGLRNGFAAFVALLDYLTLVGFLFYGVALRIDQRVLERWIRTVTSVAVVVAVYGWFQWVFVPPWDGKWLVWSGMTSSMGQPIPYKFSVCSTLASRGPFAWFMALAIVPMIALPRWRRGAGWFGVFLVASSTVLSMARTAWALGVIGSIVFAALRGGRSGTHIVLGLSVCFISLMWLIPQLPESERLQSRVESLSNLQNDASFRARQGIASRGFNNIVTNPIGLGLGSAGTAGKVSSGQAIVIDNGVVELFLTFGVLGTFLFAVGIANMAKQVVEIWRSCRSELASLSLSLLACGIIGLASANWFASETAAIAVALLGGVVGSRSTRPSGGSSSAGTGRVSGRIRHSQVTTAFCSQRIHGALTRRGH